MQKLKFILYTFINHLENELLAPLNMHKNAYSQVVNTSIKYLTIKQIKHEKKFILFFPGAILLDRAKHGAKSDSNREGYIGRG